MELVWLIYGIGLLGNIHNTTIILLIFCIAVVIGKVLNESHFNLVKTKSWLIASLSISFVLVILPSEKTAYIMVGAYAAQQLTQNSEVQKLSGKVLTIIEQQMDKYIAEGSKHN